MGRDLPAYPAISNFESKIEGRPINFESSNFETYFETAQRKLGTTAKLIELILRIINFKFQNFHAEFFRDTRPLTHEHSSPWMDNNNHQLNRHRDQNKI